MESILDTIKKMLGIETDYTHFDIDIITNINTTFLNLQQIGVGPKSGFSITDNTTKWNDYISGENLEAVKTYIYLKVRLLFDPPTNAFLVDAMERQIREIEWRLNVQVEGGDLNG